MPLLLTNLTLSIANPSFHLSSFLPSESKTYCELLLRDLSTLLPHYCASICGCSGNVRIENCGSGINLHFPPAVRFQRKTALYHNLGASYRHFLADGCRMRFSSVFSLAAVCSPFIDEFIYDCPAWMPALHTPRL